MHSHILNNQVNHLMYVNSELITMKINDCLYNCYGITKRWSCLYCYNHSVDILS